METHDNRTFSRGDIRCAALSVVQPRVAFAVTDRRWHARVPQLERLLVRCLKMSRPWLDRDRNPNILLTNDKSLKALNFNFRGKNKPTNVLTFEEAPGFGDGDIALAYETVYRESSLTFKPFRNHLAHLIIHGLLHLCGHDHHRPNEARLMEMIETRILAKMGVPNPWHACRKYDLER